MTLKAIIAAGFFAISFIVAPAGAQEKTELTPGIVEQLDTVANLTNYGIARNDPLLLIAAARMLATIEPEAADSAPAMSVQDLIAKARELGGDDSSISALADDAEDETSRGRCYNSENYGCF